MIPNAPGRFASGFHGPSGRTNAFGRYWEPDMFALYDILDTPPTAAEIQKLLDERTSLPTNTYGGFAHTTGGVCYPDGPSNRKLFKVHLISHKLQFNSTTYYHYALVRHPEVDTPHTGSYPVLLLLHGRTSVALGVSNLVKWGDTLNSNNFFRDDCVVVYPLYFGFKFQMPYRWDPLGTEEPMYTYDCEGALDGEGIPLFDGQYVETLATNGGVSPESPTPAELRFQMDYQADGYSANDVQIMAVLQSLAAVFGEQNTLGLDLNGDVGLLGGSMGCNMLYDVAPILHENGAPGTLKVSVALYGGTDQYAPFNVRRSKRLLASMIKQRVPYDDLPGVTYLADRFTYGDILNNQRERTISDPVRLYLWLQDSSLPPPSEFPDPMPHLPDLKEQLRRWFLEESVARLWDYPTLTSTDGPWPLQVHHGSVDTTVSVLNSRWLAEQMRQHEVPFDEDHFQYFETPFVGHERNKLNSRAAMATILENNLG